MTMLFSDYRSLCLVEICNQTQHNILTPRGAEVRDTIAWSSAPDAWGSDKYNQATALQADGGPRRPPITSQNLSNVCEAFGKFSSIPLIKAGDMSQQTSFIFSRLPPWLSK
ncbi:hypothetical protein AGMMS50276_22460 [Synergistales bacterium]|nr:hypothetical protein AGMMS50276_22460 [Synergistales bacterium]